MSEPSGPTLKDPKRKPWRWRLSSVLLLIFALAVLARLVLYRSPNVEVRIVNQSGQPLRDVALLRESGRVGLGTIAPGAASTSGVPRPLAGTRIVYRRDGADAAVEHRITAGGDEKRELTLYELTILPHGYQLRFRLDPRRGVWTIPVEVNGVMKE